MNDQLTGPGKTISQMLASINADADADQLFVIAAAFNLYYEAMKRQGNRHLFHPADVVNLFSITRTYLSIGAIEAVAGDVEGEIGQKVMELTGAPRRPRS